MTPKERFIAALERKPLTGRVPHFELVFYLTMEAFGEVHPQHLDTRQWNQMSERERELHRNRAADVYVRIAKHYGHSAIFVHGGPHSEDELKRVIDLIRDRVGDDYFIMTHGDATYAMPTGTDMAEQAMWFYEHMDEAKKEADRRVDVYLDFAQNMRQHGGLDGFALCSDYCFNTNPFVSPDMFGEIITPYLTRLVAGQRGLGYHVIKHTDGNIMPILDQLVSAQPHAIHSLDPQAGVDIAEVKRLYGDQVCLIGNVNCGLLQTGTEEEVIESARYALKHGMPGGGYIFSTSNSVYTGMPLERYELMLKVWEQEGNYPGE